VKRTWKEKLLIVGLAAFTLASFGYAGWMSLNLSNAISPAQKPNILVISVCSLRRDLLQSYGHKGQSVMPAIDRFFNKSSAVFENSFNGIPWISMVAFMGRFFPSMIQKGYTSGSPYYDLPYIRVPLQKSYRVDRKRNSETINNSEFEKEHKIYTDEIKRQLLSPHDGPFLLVTHFKYMHYPLIDRFNKEAQWDRFLNAEDKARVKEYLDHPEKYYAKLPLLLMLTADSKYALAHPTVAKTVTKRDPNTLRKIGGLMTSPTYLAEWKASSGYLEDLAILKKVYAANAYDLDKILEPILNLYGNKRLQDETMIVFSGDHGETHMERDRLTHADSVFDEDLQIPTAISFPKDWRPQIRVTDQWHMDTVSELIDKVMLGEVTRKNLSSKLEEMAQGRDVFLLRDCRNSMRGVRFKNKYKYWLDTATGQQVLFDLEKDPGETRNISQSDPETADRMEALYWQNLEKFKWIFPDRCMPW
jgi:arylsulfatase A-like enzyme